MCVVTDCMTLTRARIEVPIPRKRRASCANHDKVSSMMLSCVCVCFLKEFHTSYLPQALQRFYETVMQAVLRHVRFDGTYALGVPQALQLVVSIALTRS